jgi:hypothetical protein
MITHVMNVKDLIFSAYCSYSPFFNNFPRTSTPLLVALKYLEFPTNIFVFTFQRKLALILLQIFNKHEH